MIIELLACIGLTFILKYATILDWIRTPITRFSFFEDLFSCSLCLGFWSGLAVFYVTRSTILLPLVSSCVCWFADYILMILQLYELKLDKDLN